MANLGRWLAWLARLAWLLVAIVGGSAVEQAVHSRSDAVRLTAGIGCWVGWAIVMLALVIASVPTLTVVRVGVPLAAGVTLAAGLAGADALSLVALGAPATVAIVAVFAAEFGRSFVQASAYGDEERFPLRAPAAVAIAAVVTWFVWAACLLTGPLLLAARSWIAGAVLTIAAIAGLVFLGPRWHRLARRWLVLVPAGVVLHDPVVLADTVSLRSAQVARIRLAPEDTDAADLTGPGQRVRPRGADHRVDHGGLRVHAVGTERPGDPPDRLPRLPEPPRQRARRRRPPRPARRLSNLQRSVPDLGQSALSAGDAAAEHAGVGRVVQHDALTRRDPALRLVPFDTQRRGVARLRRERSPGAVRRGRCTARARRPRTGSSTHVMRVDVDAGSEHVDLVTDGDDPARGVDVDDVALRAAAGQADALALPDRDEFDRLDLAEAGSRVSTTAARWNGMRSPRNVVRPPRVDMMKHTSWLSGLSAVRRLMRLANSRTCDFCRSPTGNIVRASWAWSSMCTT